ncbi:MAG: hypothetical protein IBX57_01135 [Gammaproteobacteria bacterium]|nr:hypothetical protein [Gammaproteobacteria bacterium]
MSDFNQNVREIADMLKKGMKVEDGGVVTLDPKAYEETLDMAGIKLADIKKVQDHRDLIVAGQGLALGELGTEYMKKHKKVDTMSVEGKLHKDVIGSTFQREKHYPMGEGLTKYGVLSSKVQANGAGNKGQLKKVRAHLNTLAEQAFCK